MILPRPGYLLELQRALDANPVCALLGPRQCGKTTLARQFAARYPGAHHFDLEVASDRAALAQPDLALPPLRGLVVIDEIQRSPDLFRALRPLVDRPGPPARYLVLGSASPTLIRGVSESLAGRVGFVDLSGFGLAEVGGTEFRRLWLRGGFPRSFLAADDAASLRWRDDFVRTFLERDIPELGLRVASESLRRFWMLVAHHHGQLWNAAEISRALGVSANTVRRYLDILAGTYVVRRLPPWHENLKKREVRSPKVYLRDSGLLHALLGVADSRGLLGHPKVGASWEGLAIEQILAQVRDREAWFWRTHGGAELDLLLLHQGRRLGFEIKHVSAPTMSRSLHVALDNLRLDRAFVVYPGERRYALHDRVEALPLTALAAGLP